jgi:hypothetical protein
LVPVKQLHPDQILQSICFIVLVHQIHLSQFAAVEVLLETVVVLLLLPVVRAEDLVLQVVVQVKGRDIYSQVPINRVILGDLENSQILEITVEVVGVGQAQQEELLDQIAVSAEMLYYIIYQVSKFSMQEAAVPLVSAVPQVGVVEVASIPAEVDKEEIIVALGEEPVRMVFMQQTQ